MMVKGGRSQRMKDGKSIRAEEQARKLHEQTGEYFRTQIRGNFSTKKQAHEYENNLIKKFKKVHGSNTLPGNKSEH